MCSRTGSLDWIGNLSYDHLPSHWTSIAVDSINFSFFRWTQIQISPAKQWTIYFAHLCALSCRLSRVFISRKNTMQCQTFHENYSFTRDRNDLFMELKMDFPVYAVGQHIVNGIAIFSSFNSHFFSGSFTPEHVRFAPQLQRVEHESQSRVIHEIKKMENILWNENNRKRRIVRFCLNVLVQAPFTWFVQHQLTPDVITQHNTTFALLQRVYAMPGEMFGVGLRMPDGSYMREAVRVLRHAYDPNAPHAESWSRCRRGETIFPRTEDIQFSESNDNGDGGGGGGNGTNKTHTQLVTNSVRCCTIASPSE